MNLSLDNLINQKLFAAFQKLCFDTKYSVA